MPEAKNLIRIFSENIQRRRKQLGMTQEELAERLDISQQSMSRMERGIMAPKFERLAEIASALRCPVAELFMCNATAQENGADGDNEESAHVVLAEALGGLSPAERHCVLRFVLEAANLFKNFHA